MRNVYDRSNPVVVISNESSVVPDATVKALIKGLQSQVNRDFFPAWGVKCLLVMGADAGSLATHAMRIHVRDVSDEPGALGYHFNPEGWPETFVFAKDDMAGGAGIEGLSVTLSHEILEMLADPGVNLYALGPAYVRSKWRTVSYPYEVCDPVQGNTYISDGVAVSDFVFPEWFEPEREPGAMKMNFAGTLSAPFRLDRNGYASYRYGGRWYDSWGASRRTKPGRHRRMVRDSVIEHAAGQHRRGVGMEARPE
jgi:hypothetical protein